MESAAHAYNIYEAKTNFSRLVSEAESGDEVVISRNGRPVVRLVPIEQKRALRTPGFAAGTISIAPDFDDFDEQDERDWYGE